MAASWILILLALLGLGGTAIVVVTIAVAVAKNRPGLAVLALGLGFGALLVAGAAGFLFVGYGSRAEVVTTEYNVGPVHWQIDGPVDGPYPSPMSWRLSGLKLLLMGAGVLAVTIGVVRHLSTKNTLGKHRLGWPQALTLMIATVAMLGFIAVRWVSAPVHPHFEVAHGQVHAEMRHAQQMAEEMQHSAATMHAEISSGAAQMNIQALEDKYTAPRILLAPPVAPAPPMATAQPAVRAADAADVVVEEQSSAETTEETPEEQTITDTAASDDASAVSEDQAASDTSESYDDADSDPSADVVIQEESSTGDAKPDELTSEVSVESAAEEGASESDEESNPHASASENAQPAQAGASPSKVPSGETARAAAAAAKEITAGLASFANAMNRVVAEYTRAASVEATPTALAIEPSASTASSKPRPSWIDDPPKRIGEIRRDVIITDEYATVKECYRAADIYLLLATYEHLAQLAGFSHGSDNSRPDLSFHYDQVLANGNVILSNGHPHDHRLHTLSSMGINADFIRREIAKEEHVETVERSVGPMKRLYTLVEFTDSVDRELQRRWAAHERGERFAMVGLGAGSILGLLGGVWGLLKVDTLTKGYYTKRLFLGVPLGILGGFGLLVLFMETIGGQ